VIRFKVDENLHPDVVGVLVAGGHEAETVWDEGLRGTPDGNLAGVCKREGRALLTLDLDFADIRTYPPREYAGLVVIRAARQDRGNVVRIVRGLLPMFEAETLVGRLWVVDEGGVRIRGEQGK
jgi:predicted nuclease of predicted toxin-antitoxin system